MAKFSRRSTLKVVAGLFAFIPAVQYLANTAPALADGNPSPSYELPGCQSCQGPLPFTYCWGPGGPSDWNTTGPKTIWVEYLCFNCYEGFGIFSVNRWIDTCVPC